MNLWRRIAEIWLRSAMDPFFMVKMKINEIVIREVAEGVFPDHEKDIEAQNAVAEFMMHSSIHDQINELARSVMNEIEKQKKERSEETLV